MKNFSVALTFVLLIALVAACVPSEQQVSDAMNTAAAQITYVPVTWTPDVNTIVAQTFAAMTAQAALTQSADSVTPTPAPGSISGTLSYPSEGIVPLRVVAFNVDGLSYRFVDTLANQATYQITGLTPGVYHVVAYTMDGTLAGGYTLAVPCGLAFDCEDHSLIEVTVTAGEDTADIDPGDWYAPPGTFPSMP